MAGGLNRQVVRSDRWMIWWRKGSRIAAKTVYHKGRPPRVALLSGAWISLDGTIKSHDATSRSSIARKHVSYAIWSRNVIIARNSRKDERWMDASCGKVPGPYFHV